MKSTSTVKTNLIEKFRLSAQELKKPQAIAIAGMLLALRIVLGYFSNMSLTISPSIKFGFSFIPNALIGILFGPVVACAAGALGDILSFLLNPQGGAYFPGWTIDAMLGGLIYGIFLYKTKITLPKIIISKVLIGFGVEMLLGTLWLKIQFGMPYFISMGSRGIKQLVCVPIEIAVIFGMSLLLKKTKILKR